MPFLIALRRLQLTVHHRCRRGHVHPLSRADRTDRLSGRRRERSGSQLCGADASYCCALLHPGHVHGALRCHAGDPAGASADPEGGIDQPCLVRRPGGQAARGRKSLFFFLGPPQKSIPRRIVQKHEAATKRPKLSI